MSALASVLKRGIHLYRYCLRPLMAPACRFEPSCSAYALEALTQYGAWGGSKLIVRRVIRCRPGVPCGHDPVPAHITRS